ncbi:nwd2 [Moniliophthora roreri]|nr:nwd2 [Moniliophthora roreri]
MSMFQDARGFHISGGQFNAAINHIYSADPLHPLWLVIKDVGANHNSGTRYPPPRCHPDTRQDVIHVLHEWIHCPFPGQPIMWLYGPAGAGKSAIAQTVAETGQTQGFLVASFFFSREDPRRCVADSLCLCIAYGLATRIPELWESITQAIKRDPAILQATLKEQLEKLIVEPFRSLEQLHSHPWLIVIDGLDECKGSWEQQHILSLLATVFPKQIPLRFLICSRPEPHIREAFDVDGFRPYLCRVALDETFEPSRDITTFLNSEFKRISTHPRNRHISFPNSWPESGAVYELVHKASGQFIYAATVIKFIDNEYSNPCTQLEQVLHPTVRRNLETSSPFHDLDILYHQILSSNPHRSKVRDVIWTLILLGPRMSLTPEIIEVFLFLPKGDVISTLRGMHSILNVRGPRDEIQIFHASFSDFLRDKSRSAYFFLGSELEQNSFLACRTCRILERYSQLSDKDEDDGSCPKYNESVQLRVFLEAWYTWGDYCSKSDLNHELLIFLRNYDFSTGFNIQDRGFLLHHASPTQFSSFRDNTVMGAFVIADAQVQTFIFPTDESRFI